MKPITPFTAVIYTKPWIVIIRGYLQGMRILFFIRAVYRGNGLLPSKILASPASFHV